MTVLQQLCDKGRITEDAFKTEMENVRSSYKPAGFKRIEFGHIPNFIKSVMVHPLAPDWFVETVTAFCQNNSVHCFLALDVYKVQESNQDESEAIEYEFVELAKLFELIDNGQFSQALHISSVFLALRKHCASA